MPPSNSPSCPQAPRLVQRPAGCEPFADKQKRATVQFLLPLPWVSPAEHKTCRDIIIFETSTTLLCLNDTRPGPCLNNNWWEMD